MSILLVKAKGLWCHPRDSSVGVFGVAVSGGDGFACTLQDRPCLQNPAGRERRFLQHFPMWFLLHLWVTTCHHWALWLVAWLEQQLRKVSVAGGACDHHHGARAYHAGPGPASPDGQAAAAGFCPDGVERGVWKSRVAIISHFEVKREPFHSL